MRVFALISAIAVSASVALAHAPLTMPGDEVLLRLTATGVQIYECRRGAAGQPEWVFREPRADLFQSGRRVGRHFGGPTWASSDGSQIVGKVVASVAAGQAGDIPWLRLSVVSRSGEGTFTPVTAIQRVETQGGVLSGVCPELGALSEAPYSALYVMLRAL